MAYFPNGQSGDIYMDRYCFNCHHWQDLDDGRGHGCPVWDIHLTSNYDRVKEPEVMQILDTLIPMDKEMNPEQCAMFIGQADIEGQTKLF